MSFHTMALSEADPAHPGFKRRYYATIDVILSGFSWEWTQVDINGNYFGQTYSSFASEKEAKSDALAKLNGDNWEE